MTGDRSGVLAWALGTFHACVVGLLLLLLIFPGGGLGPLLGGLDTTTGLVIFIALWATSVWTARRALSGGDLPSTAPGWRRAFIRRALRWGAATGILFLIALGAIFLGRTLIVAPGTLDVVGVIGFGALAGGVGLIFASVIGGVLGVVLGGLDLLAVAVAGKVAGSATASATRTLDGK